MELQSAITPASNTMLILEFTLLCSRASFMKIQQRNRTFQEGNIRSNHLLSHNQCALTTSFSCYILFHVGELSRTSSPFRVKNRLVFSAPSVQTNVICIL